MTEDTAPMMHESPEYRQEQLSAALDGMLTTNEQAALDAHLAGCASCTRELEALRQVRMMLRALPQPAPPRSFLLPMEGELNAQRVPARQVEQPATTNVTPLRQPARQGVGSRTTGALRATRWIGTIAAVLGLALFLGTLLPLTLSHPNTASNGSAPMYGVGGPPATTSKDSATETSPSPTGGLQSGGQTNDGATATPSSPAPTLQSTVTPTATPPDVNESAPAFGDILRVVALVLLFAGIALALLAFVLARLV
jgi:Putative zinc-finger